MTNVQQPYDKRPLACKLIGLGQSLFAEETDEQLAGLSQAQHLTNFNTQLIDCGVLAKL